MGTEFDILYLSPHLDDAVYSCGGQIARAVREGARVLIATACAGDAEAGGGGGVRDEPLRRALEAATPAQRRAEDEAAASRLGATVRHGPFAEAACLHDPAGGALLYPTLRSLWGALHPLHAAQAPALADWIRALPPHARRVAPLSWGRHVDHRLLRAAAERAGGPALEYYEDFPYAQRWSCRLLGLLLRVRLASHTIPLSPTDVQARIDAARCYASQNALIFGGDARLEAHIRRHVRRVGGERVWRPFNAK